MKRRWICGALVICAVLGVCEFDAAPAQDDRGRQPDRGAAHGARANVARSRHIAPADAENDAFDRKLVVISLTGADQPTVLEQARFEEIHGRAFVVGKEVKSTASSPLGTEAHVAWDAVKSFHLFDSSEQFEGALRNALEADQGELSEVVDGFLDPSHIRKVCTVNVPVIRSSAYCDGFGERLTEAVEKRIEETTPFKVVPSPDLADSVLDCTIVCVEKEMATESPAHESRENNMAFAVKVAWTDGEGGEIRPQALVHLPTLDRDADTFPELGQPLTTHQQQAIHRLAKEIVGMIEAQW